MRTALGKLGFLHRRLWSSDPTYRVASVIGPPPLIGIAVAFILWSIFRPGDTDSVPNAVPWAHYTPSVGSQPDASPIAVAPEQALPAHSAAGWTGWTTGWNGAIEPIVVSPSNDVDLLPEKLATFSSNDADIDLERILPFGPSDRLFMGVDRAHLAITTAGRYGISVEVTRDADRPADCLVRLAFANRRLVSTLQLGITTNFRHVFEPVGFDLRPGLYGIVVAFGCWHGGQVVGPGKAFVVLRRPGQSIATKARPDEILRSSPVE